MISLTSPVETWAHRVPAGPKLAALSLATAGLFWLDDPYRLGGACVAVAGLMLSNGRDFARAMVQGFRPLLWFLVLIALWHGATGQIADGIAVALRLLSALALANFVTMTTRLDDMIAVVALLAAPLRKLGIETRALELSIALVIRFTPAIAHKGARLSEAWRARALRPGGWRIVVPLAATALDDAEHVAEALRARGGFETARYTDRGN
jgi:biotin transport system permease protein